MAEGETLGKYLIRRTLGRGAAGVVLEGWDPIIQRRVAIKSVRLDESNDPETREQIDRFRREARAAGQLIHPNIVTIHDYGETSDVAYIVMEFVEGPSLKEVLDLGRMLDQADVIRIMEDILAGLAYSHQHGVIHRDIKPGNVMLTSRDLRLARAKIADYGIARIESSTLTQAGTMMGTPAYMAPEQFLGATIDSRSDIYAAGALLYQLLTGQRPFEGSISSIMHQVLTTEAHVPSAMVMTVDPAFDPVVMRALAKQPAQRFQYAAAFAEALHEAASGQTPKVVDAPVDPTIQATAIAPVVFPPPSRPILTATAEGGGTRWSMAVAALGLVTAIGLGAWLFLSTTRQSALTDRVLTPPPARVAEVTPPAVAPSPVATQPGGPVAPPVAPLPTPAVVASPGPPSSAQPLPTPPAPTQPPPGLASPTPTSPIPTSPIPASPVPSLTATPDLVPPAPATTPPVAALPPPPGPRATPPDQAATAPPPPIVAALPVGAFSPAGAVELARAVSGMRCALVDGATSADGAVLRGVAASGSEPRLRALLAERRVTGRLDWQVHATDPAFCGALDLLRPLGPPFDADGPRIRLTLADDRLVLREGDAIRPRIIMPAFSAYLQVDYIAHDGTVQHLYPQAADPRQGIKADPVRVFAPSEWVNLGDPAPGQRGWEASEPFGRDMLVTIATSRPLFATPRPNNAEPAEVYLQALERALQAVRQAGADAAVAAIPVQVTPR